MLRDTLSTKAFTARQLAESGMFAPTRPDRLARVVKTLRGWGPTIAGGYGANAIRFPDATAIIDDHGALTFGELHRRTNALAHAWSDDGIVEGDAIALLCRNHRGFVEALVAASKLGAHTLFLNTAFSAPQLAGVCESEDPQAVVYDEEFSSLVKAAAAGRRRYVAWSEPGSKPPPGATALDALIERGDRSDVVPPQSRGRS